MTKKRFIKLARAYFTRMNEWGKANGKKPLHMGELYSRLEFLADFYPNGDPLEMTRAEWWEMIAKGDTFGVGVKQKGVRA
jgi:hypothetical protein